MTVFGYLSYDIRPSKPSVSTMHSIPLVVSTTTTRFARSQDDPQTLSPGYLEKMSALAMAMAKKVRSMVLIMLPLTLISSTWAGSSMGLPFLAKKSCVSASRMSEQNTLSSIISPGHKRVSRLRTLHPLEYCVSPFSGLVHFTMGISM